MTQEKLDRVNGVNGEADKPRTKGELEAALSRRFIQLEKNYSGRGPLETRTFLIDDMVLVRLRGVLTQSEQKLAAIESRGIQLIKQARLELTACKRPEIEEMIAELLGANVRSLHTDICPKAGERIIVLSLDRKPTLALG